MAEQTGSSPMFAIFVLSLLSLALIPYTIYHLTSQGEAGDVVKPWQVRSLSNTARVTWLSRILFARGIVINTSWFQP